MVRRWTDLTLGDREWPCAAQPASSAIVAYQQENMRSKCGAFRIAALLSFGCFSANMLCHIRGRVQFAADQIKHAATGISDRVYSLHTRDAFTHHVRMQTGMRAHTHTYIDMHVYMCVCM